MANTIVILQGIAIATNILTVVFLVIVVAIFGDAYSSLNAETDSNSRLCPLYLKDNNDPKDPTCIIVITFEVLAGLGLLVLIKASILKLVRQENK